MIWTIMQYMKCPQKLLGVVSKTKLIILAVSTVIAMSITFATPAFAADVPSDLSLSLSSITNDRLLALTVCNNGASDVKSFTLNLSHENYEPYFSTSLPSGYLGVDATDPGEYNSSTGIWSGLVETSQCVSIGMAGNITGDVGETVVQDVAIVSSLLGDDSVNIDPDTSNDVAHYESSPIVLIPDIAMSTRLLTTGLIEDNSQVEYEVTMSNVGQGDYIDPGVGVPLGLYFIMPTGSSLDSIVDNDLTDSIDIQGCGEVGQSDVIGPGLSPYPGLLAGCSFTTSDPIPPGYTFTFKIVFSVDSAYISGTTRVVAIGTASEPDAILFQANAMLGVDPFSVDSNNFDILTYDSSPLVPTVDRCVGQGETTTNGSGCFTITFNKQIYAPDFTVGDLGLLGGGNISSFEQIGPNTWQIHISDIPLGATISLIFNDAAIVRDYSAILSSTQVLGINTIRYEDTSSNGSSGSNNSGSASGASSSNSATGTLAATGRTSDLVTPVLLMLIGMLIVGLTSKRSFRFIRVWS